MSSLTASRPCQDEVCMRVCYGEAERRVHVFMRAPPVCEHCTCTWVFDGKKPALPGCISISHPTRPPAWPQPCDSASDTNPFQPCLCCVRGEARLDGHVLLSSHHSLVHCTPSKSSLAHNKWQWNMAPNSRSGEAEKRKPKVVFSWG